MLTTCRTVLVLALLGLGLLHAQEQKSAGVTDQSKFMADVMVSIPPGTHTYPLYGEAVIPNSKPGPDQEKVEAWGMTVRVSRPTIHAYLPAKAKENGTSVLVFPGGGYEMLNMEAEGARVAQFFQDHGVAAFVVKYRLPSDATMEDKSIGPLQDAQQAIRFVRQHAQEWKLDPARVGVIGFSAGGHLASTLGTHFEEALVDSPDRISLRPDFMILGYPGISNDPKIAHQGSTKALLGENPSEDKLRFFSNEFQVTEKTPPTLLLAAADDKLLDVENSIVFFDALRHHGVAVEMTILERGEHGFLLIPRDRWESLIVKWMESHGWLEKSPTECQGRSKTRPVWRSKSRPVDSREVVVGLRGRRAAGA